MSVLKSQVSILLRGIGNSPLVLFLLTMPYLEPQIFKTDQFISYDAIFDVLKLISAAIILLIYISTIRFNISRTVILAICLQAWIFLSTLVMHGSVSRFAGPAITMVVMTMVGELALKTNICKYLKYVWLTLAFLVILNLISLAGIHLHIIPWENPILGIDNRWLYTLLPWIMISFLGAKLEGTSMRLPWIVYVISLVHVVVVWSVGACIALFLWPVFWVLARRLYSSVSCSVNSCASRIMFSAFLIMNVVLIFNIVLPHLSSVISGVFHKDVTLAGRTYLWSTAINVIKESPLFGMGVQSERFDMAYFFEQSGYVVGCAVNHPHNNLLNIAYHGGVVALGLYLLLLFKSMKAIDKGGLPEISACMWCCFAVFFTAGLIDTLDYSLFHLMIPITCGIKNNMQEFLSRNEITESK